MPTLWLNSQGGPDRSRKSFTQYRSHMRSPSALVADGSTRPHANESASTQYLTQYPKGGKCRKEPAVELQDREETGSECNKWVHYSKAHHGTRDIGKGLFHFLEDNTVPNWHGREQEDTALSSERRSGTCLRISLDQTSCLAGANTEMARDPCSTKKRKKG